MYSWSKTVSYTHLDVYKRQEQGRTFEDVHERLSEIVDEVSAEDISLDDALKLYEEAVKLGLSACDLSEQDLDAFLATEEETTVEEGGASDTPTGSDVYKRQALFRDNSVYCGAP